MFSRDREWEDLQRDCSFFPAYTDYLFGLDTRPHVKDEPGLHPQLFVSTPDPPGSVFAIGPAGLNPCTDIPSAHSQHHVFERDAPYLRGGRAVEQFNRTGQASHHRIEGDMRQLRSSVQLGMGMAASRPPSLQEMERRRMLNAAQHLPADVSSSPTSSQQLLRDARQRNGSLQHQGLAASLASPLQLSTSATNNNHPFTSLTSHAQILSPQNLDTEKLHDASIRPSIQPNDLTTNPQYSFIPAHHRVSFNSALNKLWKHVNSHPDTNFRAECLSRIQVFSASIWEEQAKFKTQEHNQQQPIQTQTHHPNTYAPTTSSNLSERTKLYIHASLPKLLRCLDATNSPITTQVQKDVAREWVTAFMATLSPDAQHFVQMMLQRVYAMKEEEKKMQGLGVGSGGEEGDGEGQEVRVGKVE